MSSIAKAIEDERKVNAYSMKGSVDQFSIARFKVYHAAKIVSFKFDERNEKRFNPRKLGKSLAAVEKDKGTIAGDNSGVMNSARSGDKKKEAAEAAAHEEKHEGSESVKPSRLRLLELKNPLLGFLKTGNQPKTSGTKTMAEDKSGDEELDLSMGSNQSKLNQTIDTKNKMSLKTVIQNLLKNTKNIFTKEEANQPNDMLLRTIVIKKLILYLILTFMALSSIYLGYSTIYMQYQSYEFKVDSLYKVTRYQNLTVAVLNEYFHRDAINSRDLDSSYSASTQIADLKDVDLRIRMFKDQLNSFDIDYNVRQDLFFKGLSQAEQSFTVRYDNSSGETRQASKYTILMIMLEKVLTMDNSQFDKVEAFSFINDNFLHVVNAYFLEAFAVTRDECNKMVADGKVN